MYEQYHKIELTGDANHTIFVNSNYEELGAVASDGDPNYIPNYTITTSGSLNNTMVGSFELYTYIADPDACRKPWSVILAAYPLEFDTKMSNVRLPFVSF